MKTMIDAVKAHASDNYEEGGWDYVVECFSSADIEEIIVEAGAKTVAAAIKAVGVVVGHKDDYRKEIQATAW